MESRDIKCTNPQRTTTSQILADAMAVGQLSVTEFEERSDACAAATTRGELLDLVSDLLDDPERVLFGGHDVAQRSSHELHPASCQMRVFGTGVLGTRYCRVPGSWYRAEGCVGPDRLS